MNRHTSPEVSALSDTEQSEPRCIRLRWVVVATILLVIVVIAGRSILAPEILVAPGTPIQFDDFAFSIVGSRDAVLGEGDSARKCLVVTLKVQNNAARVPYQFLRKTAVMVDDAGREYEFSAEGQAILDHGRTGPDTLAGPIPAGSSGTTDLAFEMPDRAKNPRMKISHGGPILDVVDDVLLGKRRLRP